MLSLLKINENNEKHIKDLYQLLNKKKFNISHEKLPTFLEHKIFIKNNPYRIWYLVQKFDKIIGSIYITNDNKIGINIPDSNVIDYYESIKLILKKHKPLKGIKSVRSKNFCINTNPQNNNLIEAMKKLDMEHIENTYRFKN